MLEAQAHSNLDLATLSQALDAAVRILVHRLRPRFNSRIQCLLPLDKPVDVFLEAAAAEPVLTHQARDGAIWGARRLRDDLRVSVLFNQLSRGTALDYAVAQEALDLQLKWTSEIYLRMTLEPDDERLARPFTDYTIPLTPEGPVPFWLGAAWGMTRYHGLARLALRAQEQGDDILESWEAFQTR